MNFYLDFEATQFSERIISIGCVCDNGNEFYTLVRPPKGDKVNGFITRLTGITQEMVENADIADVAFIALRDFIQRNSNGKKPHFFVYGSNDFSFIRKTMEKMIDEEAKKFLSRLSASLVNYCPTAKRFFKVSQIGLARACAKFRGEEIVQRHNALEDADLLRELVYMINNHSEMLSVDFEPAPIEKLKPQPSTTPKSTKPKEKPITGKILMYGHAESQNQKLYKNFESALDIVYLKTKASMPLTNRETIKKNLTKAIRNGTSYRGWLWKEIAK